MSEYGIHQGTVTQNVDLKTLGRVQVSVPAVLGDGKLAWALPCTPFSGKGVGLYTVPPVGAKVWVAFEDGDLDKAVVLGGFWEVGEVPAPHPLPTLAMLKTGCISVTLDDLPGGGGLTIEISPPAVSMPIKIAATSAGLELSVGASKIVLNGVTVKVNDGALEVM